MSSSRYMSGQQTALCCMLLTSVIPAALPAPAGAMTSAEEVLTMARRHRDGCLQSRCHGSCRWCCEGCGCAGRAASGAGHRPPSQKMCARGLARAGWPWACRQACLWAPWRSRWRAGAAGSVAPSPRLDPPCGRSVTPLQAAGPQHSCRAPAAASAGSDAEVVATLAQGSCTRAPAALLAQTRPRMPADDPLSTLLRGLRDCQPPAALASHLKCPPRYPACGSYVRRARTHLQRR